ncbi:hypothetical protein GGU10DRAFT_350139 [Lentinula aff. detonsa]|uniref:Uncharacterized protein n=1 Tax=Lentinula aff. detonsa TaxID=2804958 RepID=A0AA38KFP9_9AGAR|nr:hypothetical protein GGU10DRAFT_350139 [Lentinula aff. detonsa]
MDAFPRWASLASPNEAATPFTTPPRSLTPLLYVDSEPTYSPYDPYDAASARSEKEDAEWQILFEKMGRAPTPFKSPPPPGWQYVSCYTSGGGSGTGYLTPKSRSLSPPRSRYPYPKPRDDELRRFSDNQDMSWLRDDKVVDKAIEEMQDDVQSIEKDLTPVDLQIINSKLTEHASTTATGTRRRKSRPPVQTTPIVTRSIAKRRLTLKSAYTIFVRQVLPQRQSSVWRMKTMGKIWALL